ncbi:MAG: hypothetical protein ACE5IQ_02630 [Candidatus Methylomirabilales bacterium]
MVFAYYNRLTRAQQRIYQQSDKVTTIPLPQARRLHPLVKELAEALEREDRRKTEAASQELVSALTARLKATPVHVEVLATRPSRSWGELHGLYTPAEGQKPARVTVWMRTAQRRRVVAFRTFLRTLLHEVCHHLDYELLGLQETFHTEGFYRRESSLFHQLVPNRPQEDSPTTES